MNSITIVETVIDSPTWREMKSVCSLLERASINGHRVLAAQYHVPHPQDVVKVPHRGCSYKCGQTGSDRCVELAAATLGTITRYFNVRLILEGSYYLVDHDVSDFQIDIDILVMLVQSRVRPLIAESERTPLSPWEGSLAR